MMRREEQANTYLGGGIAIPHGQPKDRDIILKTGIMVVQILNAVESIGLYIVAIAAGTFVTTLTVLQLKLRPTTQQLA